MESNQHDNFEKKDLETNNEQQLDVSSGFNRRKFIKTAILTAPVVLTVTSRPVFAGSCSESGQLSGNLSNAEECFGEGCSPGFWKNHTADWHYAYPTDMSFNTAFGIVAGGPLEYQTLGEVIWYAEVTLDNSHSAIEKLIIRLGFHAVAALQNSATDIKYPHTTIQVKDMILALFTTNGFTTEQDKKLIEDLKDYFDVLNNDYCPL
ncbi:MAG: hypothetical protein PF503_09950 [Desulfobacula sp.]|jgi:hypothetical protein|nr:hypothetical protein [Desulfobacula sp.]